MRKWIGFAVFYFISGVALSQTESTQHCRFTKVSGITAAELLRMEKNNEFFWFDSYGDAQVACANLEPCTGITGNDGRGFGLSTGFPQSSRESVVWLKECKPSCELVLTEKSIAGMSSAFSRRCSNTDAAVGDIANIVWSTWGPWGACTHTCSQDGFQTRMRQCSSHLEPKGSCNVTDREFRGCHRERLHDCSTTIENVYGIVGPEGFVFATNVRIYKTCIHSEVADRLQCGDQTVVTRNLCNQYNCCYQEDWQRVGGPKCFQTQSFIGSVGRLGWAIWGAWSSCTASCGNGKRVRRRMCTGSNIGSPICPHSNKQVQACGSADCPCDSMPCLNGGTCIPNKNVLYGYECLCAKGFSGKSCFYGEPDLKCGDDSITVQFHEGLVIEDGLIPDADLIRFIGMESKPCFAQKQENMFYLSLPPPIDKSCGSQIHISDEQLTIRNKVLWKLSDGFFDATVVLVDISCAYNKRINSSVGLGFGIQPVLRTIVEKRVVEALDAKMFLYRDDSFLPSHRFKVAPRIAQGELLYASVDLAAMKISQYSSTFVKADDCWVLDAADGSSIVHQLLKDGCPTNDVFISVIQNGDSHQVKLAIRVFDWKTKNHGSSEVFFQCKVRACTGKCLTQCGNSTSPRPQLVQESLPPRNSRTRRHVVAEELKYSTVLQKAIIML